MKEQETVTPPSTPKTSKKPGFFKRIIDKFDTAMKVKADEKSKQSCCGSDDGKDGKCC